MAAGDSKVSICNIGLLAIGADLITDIDAPYQRAIVCKQSFDRIRREVLEAHPWRFAKGLAQLAAAATAPPFGYGSAYDLPSDYVRPYDKGDDDNTDRNWEVIGSQIQTNATGPFNLVYVRDITDPNLMPPLFCKVLGLEIACQNAAALTQDAGKKAEARTALNEAWAIAKTTSAQGGNPREWGGDVLLEVRN